MSNENWPAAHNIAKAVVESMKRHKRKPSDVYPTPAEGTQGLLPVLGLPPGSKIGEPACGDGDMARVLVANGYEVIASDIRRTGYGTPNIDFLQQRSYPKVDAIITNPPFALAEDFIRRATAFAPVVALLLKANYWNTANRLKLWDSRPPTACHPVTWRLAFLKEERGDSPLMDCSWYIWRRGDPPLPRPLPRPPASVVPDISSKPLTVRLVKLEDALESLTEQIEATYG